MGSCRVCRNHRTDVDVGPTRRDSWCLARNVSPHVIACWQLGPDDDTACPAFSDARLPQPYDGPSDAELTRRFADPDWRTRAERRSGVDRRATDRGQGDRRSNGRPQ